MTQHHKQRTNVTPNLARNPAANQHPKNSFQQIPQECDQTGAQAEYAQHIGAARIAAAVISHVVFVFQAADNYRKLDVAQQVSQRSACQVQKP